jgi:TonB family protein
MSSGKWLLGIVLILRLTATDDSVAQALNEPRHGYVQCTGKKPSPIPVFENPCNPNWVGELKCGEAVEAVSRDGPWLKIRMADGSERYIGAASVSQSKKKFLAIDLPVPPGPYIQDCSAFRPTQAGTKQTGTHRPIPLYRPDAEYSDEARQSHIQGSVELSLTVGTDGIAHDIVVTKSLGHGLDENALAVVQRWRFDPATEDGKPIPARITIEVTFHFYN